MSLLKIHICSIEAPANKALLVKSLREIMIEKLKIDNKTGQVVLYEAQSQHRAVHPDRSANFVFLELLIYAGSSAEIKKALQRDLVEEVHRILNVDIEDISCCLIEIPQENWAEDIRI